MMNVLLLVLLCATPASAFPQPRPPSKPEAAFPQKGSSPQDPDKHGVQQVWPGFANPDPFNGSGRDDTATTALTDGGNGNGADPDKHGLQRMWPGYAIPDPFNGSSAPAGGEGPDKSKLQQVWPGFAKPDPVKDDDDGSSKGDYPGKGGLEPIFPEW